MALLLATIVVCSCSCASQYLYSYAIARNEKPFLNESKLKAGSALVKLLESGRAWMGAEAFESVGIVSDDGLRLAGYYLSAKEPSANTVILAHGYNGTAKDMGEYARFFHEDLAYNVLMPDARGSGASEGDYIGLGWPDRRDYLQWISWAVARVGPNARIVLLGVSMGGATVLMASGEELPSNVKAIVEDCGYTSVDDEFSYLVKGMFNGIPALFLPGASQLTKKKAGYSFKEASALNQVRKSRTPVLFIHGDADQFVPYAMALRLYAACPAEKELFIVHGAGHAESFIVDPKGYTDHLTSFLGKYLSGAGMAGLDLVIKRLPEPSYPKESEQFVRFRTDYLPAAM